MLRHFCFASLLGMLIAYCKHYTNHNARPPVTHPLNKSAFPMPYATEIKGSFHGVAIPTWLRVFDCRQPIGAEFVLAPWTVTLFGKECRVSLLGSELAEVDLGLRSKEDRHAANPSSCSGYGDARISESEAAAMLLDALAAARGHQKEWEWASTRPRRQDGGQAHYQPIAIALCNFGWSVIADSRNYLIPERETE